MDTKTQAALDEIREAVAGGQASLVPAYFSRFHGRAATSAAFRLAKREGIIEEAYRSMAGTPVYRPAPKA